MALDAKKLINHFLDDKAGLTQLAYQKDLEDFRVFAKAGSVDDAVRQLLGGTHLQGQELIARYQSDMKRRRELGSATINRRLATLRSLGKQARILGMCPWVLEAKNLRHKNVRDTRGLGLADVIKLLRYMEGLPKTRPALRDLAIIRLLTDHALRRWAIVCLNMADFRAGTRELNVRGKGERSRALCSLSKEAGKALTAWVSARGPHSGAIFVNFDLVHKSKTGKRLTGAGLYAMLKTRAKEAGITAPIRPHGIRHTMILAAVNAGLGLAPLRQLAGHSNLRTLQYYLVRDRDVAGKLSKGASGLLG